ncbi:MAG: alkaline phosphatase [Bryobacterales bacterium]|jgi:alkaline phosphatase|nr:alkaline phosphatase [Bryobacterales bacterium]
MIIRRSLLLLAVCACIVPEAVLAQAQPNKHAKNVILFLADAGGIPTLNAASALGYGAPQKLYIQNWPHIGLSDTSTASQWVTDSAAGMTAIVTGKKTNNGVLSQSAESVRGEKDGAPLKTILEYAEEKGLSTGVMTNVNIADATPAACYSHVNSRAKFGDIFSQIFKPRFGDGVDVVFGIGRKPILASGQELGIDLEEMARSQQRPLYTSLAEIPANTRRPIAVLDTPIDLPEAARLAIKTLSKNPKGYFLMIEWDAHTDNPERGLNNVVAFDKLIREIASTVDLKETLLLFTADHSFDLRMRGGLRTDPVLKGLPEWQQTHDPKARIDLPVIRLEHGHTGEEVLATSQGPGSEMVNGFFPNTRLFEVMMSAFGWTADR